MASTIGQLLHTHSTNPVHETEYTTATNKQWAEAYHPIQNLSVQTTVGQDGVVIANFDAFLPQEADDQRRMLIPAYPPNQQSWRMDSEADARHWFYHEVSDVVMPAFASYPTVVQVAEAKAFAEEHPQIVDESFTFKPAGRSRLPLIIGEFKRNLLDQDEWQDGSIVTTQQISLSRELRGYAAKYRCPQIFCFDGYVLLMLQFRAKTAESIADAHCEVDGWIIPRDNMGGTTLRYALYRLLVQGLRQCQGQLSPETLILHGQSSEFRNFYTGEPFWSLGNCLTSRPWGMYRAVAPDGSTYWMYNGEPCRTQNGQFIFDGPPMYAP